MQLTEKQQELHIVQGLRQHDKTAMRDFYALYAGRLTAVCSRYIASDADMKDVLQEALIKIFTNADSFEYRATGSLLAWGKRIVVNEALSFLRKSKTVPLLFDENLPEVADEDNTPVDDVPPKLLQEMIRELPDGYRTVFNLYVFEDKSHQEIGKILGIKESSSASQLNRAKTVLKKKIIEYKKGGRI
uniref:Sigma-70 family RNA polymerase sigma factor n=1 Tax=Prevotella sp. GTC17259 TaxID=3236795 RepID=A0AB33J9H6_9BACT